MYRFPPFYTLQPVPATLQKQLSMWANLLLQHAWYRYSAERRVSKQSGSTTSADGRAAAPHPVRLYTPNSDFFTNEALPRTLPKDAASMVLAYLAEHVPHRCAWVQTHEGSSSQDRTASQSLLVACCEGGLEALETAFFDFILEDSTSATTSADLRKNGVVTTLDELLSEGCLNRVSALSPVAAIDRSATQVEATLGHVLASKSSGLCTTEQALRAILSYLSERTIQRRSPPSFAVRMFNLDGGDEPPFEGIKIGA